MKSFICPYCDALLKTPQGLRSHITQNLFCNNAFKKCTKSAQQEESPPSVQLNFANSPLSSPKTCASTSHIRVEEVIEDNDEYQQPEALEQPASKRIRLIELDAEDEEGELPKQLFVDWKPLSEVKIQGKGKTIFESMYNNAKADGYGNKPWAPFANTKEWELAQFLASSGLSHSAIDRYLKLKWVRNKFSSLELGKY
jgi:hypothetical protein